MYRFDANGQLMMLELEAAEGTGAPPKRRPGKPDSELISIPYFHLDLVSGSMPNGRMFNRIREHKQTWPYSWPC